VVVSQSVINLATWNNSVSGRLSRQIANEWVEACQFFPLDILARCELPLCGWRMFSVFWGKGRIDGSDMVK
jgi:hypothetical protein